MVKHYLWICLSLQILTAGASAVVCQEDNICHELQGPESICGKDNICSNPFASGCLYQRLPGWNQKRVCNSDDNDNAAELGLCTPPELDYMEIRLVSGNWESIFFNAWVMQILLSELLGIPTTLEPSMPNTRINFYDDIGSVEYGIINNNDALENAQKYTDCRKASRGEEDYEPCANLIPEFWGANGPWSDEQVNKGSMEPPESLGVLAQETLYIPKFTAERDPSLLSYIGLQGEKNRQKVADAFLRPTLWTDYCAQVSNNSCSSPDEFALRPPRDEEEGDTYFQAGAYTGHFRKTEENYGYNGTRPATGHFIDYPCDWNSFAEQQFYHLDIPLSGDSHAEGTRGYKDWYFPQLLEAANATKSNFMIMWANPDPFYQSLVGTDMELHAVMMPPLTQECLEHKRNWEVACSGDPMVRVGDSRGACEQPPNPLHTAMSTSLTKDYNDPSLSLAERSPAVAAIQRYSVTTPIYGSWFNLLMDRNALKDGRSTLFRDATCQWVVDNIDLVKQWVPFSYPRVVMEGEKNTALVIVSTTLSGISILLVIVASMLVYHSQQRRVMVYAQIEFLWLLLSGLLIISVGALVSAIPPTSGSCIASVWFINVGYTIELAPLLIKVAAINRLMTASQRLKKVTVDRQQLLRSVLAVTVLLAVFVIVWTAMDPLERQGELSLSTSLTARNETIIYRTYHCSSESDVWQYVAFGWTYLLLFSSTVMAFQMRNVRQEFNESQTLGIMTYSHFVFAILRLVVFFIEDLDESDSASYASILLSVDAMATLAIYFLPKFLVLRNPDGASDRCSSSQPFRSGDFQIGGTTKPFTGDMSWRHPNANALADPGAVQESPFLFSPEKSFAEDDADDHQTDAKAQELQESLRFADKMETPSDDEDGDENKPLSKNNE